MPDFKKITDLIKKQKYLLIVLAVGIALLLLPGTDDKKSEVRDTEGLNFSIEDQERKIEKILSQSHGVGRVKVALSVRGTSESVYAEDKKQSVSESENDFSQDSDLKPSVISAGTGEDTPIIIKQLYPEFLGAAVVCDGADNSRVCLAITDTVASLTGISSEKITIIKMKD